MQRDPQAVLDDYLDELIDIDAARASYGVVIEKGRVDHAATQSLRGNN